MSNETNQKEGADPQKHTDSSIDTEILPIHQIRILGAVTHGMRTVAEMHAFLRTHGPERACQTAVQDLWKAGYLRTTEDSDAAGQTYDVTNAGLAALGDSLCALVDHVADLELVDAEAYGAAIARLEAVDGRDGELITDGGSGTHPHAGELTAFKQDILAVLSGGPLYGLAIKRALEEYYNEDEVFHGRIYPNLDELVEKGLITKSELDKRTNEYELTTDGRDYVRARADWFGRHLEGFDAEHRLAGAEPARTDGGESE